MKQGRKPGFKHSVETIEKIRQSHLGTKQELGTRSKISRSMSGKNKTPDHKERLSESMFNLDAKCLERYNALKAEYPDQEEFFEQNQEDLLFAMQDIKSEKELTDIRRYIESVPLHNSLTYEYSSSSCYAAEDAMIALVDAASFLRRFATSNS
jgi:hypothetical protein